MPRSNFRAALRTSVWFGAAAWLLAGCSLLTSAPRAVPTPVVVEPKGPDPKAPRLVAVETRHVELAKGQELIGETQVIFARYENTFSAIGRQYNLGYEEMRSANPGVDQWLPGEGTPIYLPTQSILPEAPRDGIVVNVPAMRLYYFTIEKGTTEKGTTEKGAAQGAPDILKVSTHPIGIGVEGWATPFGEAKVTQKVKDPIWYVPASIRKEHADRGDPLPSVVKPGPDNPLGAYALTLSLPSYLIHGTNKPAGVGMRSSHGCIRLYPEDIEALFSRVPRGTAVRIVNQPVLAGWRDGQLYLEVHPPLAEEQHDLVAEAETALRGAIERAGADPAAVAIDHAAIEKIVAEQRGMPLPVLRGNRSLDQYLASVRIVENTVPIAVAEETARLAEPPVNASR
jgi:L,D-transpeptidase ErfK/SrfK